MPAPPLALASRRHLHLVVLAALLAGCGGAEEAQRPPRPPPAVEAVQARSGSLPLSERVSGVVKAENQVAIRPEVTAAVAEVLVKTGDAVTRGQPLVRLRDEALREQLRRAEAEVTLAEASAAEAAARLAAVEAQVSRTRALAAEKLVSELDLETQEASLAAARAAAQQAAARVEQARATADERRSDLAKTVVRAPVGGRVGQRNVEVGMVVSPSTVLFELGDPERLVVEVPLTQEMLATVRPGQTALVHATATGGEPLRAVLSRVSPFLASESFSTVGEIDLRNPGGRLHPGAFVQVDLVHGESEEATLVPASALVEHPETGALGVWVVSGMPSAAAPGVLEETARPVGFQPVELLAHDGGTVGVRGLPAGEWVVVVGQHLLAEADDASARVRAQSWERAQELQAMQREDLLQGFLERQQRWARTRGAEPPSNEEFLRREPDPAPDGS